MSCNESKYQAVENIPIWRVYLPSKTEKTSVKNNVENNIDSRIKRLIKLYDWDWPNFKSILDI